VMRYWFREQLQYCNLRRHVRKGCAFLASSEVVYRGRVHVNYWRKNLLEVLVKAEFSAGDRVQVSDNFFWAKGATGRLSAAHRRQDFGNAAERFRDPCQNGRF
jgi:hypothetical protein